MVSGLGGADPGSVSRLGGALRTSAARLAADHVGLTSAAGQTPLGTLTGLVVQRLDALGSALQVHSQELAELTVAATALGDRVRVDGLHLDGWRVVEPFGIATSQAAARRLAAQPELQAQADRIASRIGRIRAQLARQLDQASADLAAAARTARSAG